MSDNSERPDRSAIFWGTLLIGFGVVFLLDELNIMDSGDFFSTFWPVILIAIGLKMIMNRNGRTNDQAESSVDSAKQISYSKVFGDLILKLDSKEFDGGSLSVVIGDMNIDLSEMGISSGEKALAINNQIGDINVILPKTLKVKIKANVFIGELNILDQKGDGFSVSKTYKSDGYETAKKKLSITISQSIGEIKVEG